MSSFDVTVPAFPVEYAQVSPGHPAWKKRVKLEVGALAMYSNYMTLGQQTPWFKLKPSTKLGDNFRNWDGEVYLTDHTGVQFPIYVMLPANYPQVPPRCYFGWKLLEFLQLEHTPVAYELGPGNQYFLMDYDSKECDWAPNLGIVHFFLRVVRFWWAVQQSKILSRLKNKCRVKK